jgi:hypothetical protein
MQLTTIKAPECFRGLVVYSPAVSSPARCGFRQ